MRRLLCVMAAFALLGAACSAGGGGNAVATTVNPSGSHAPVTLNVWGFFTEHEEDRFTDVVSRFENQYPWITVNLVPGKEFNDIVRGINSGTHIDVAIDVGPDNVGKYCSSGAWIDLNPYLQADNVDFTSTFPASVKTYTNYQGTQCALPMLTDAYGLYYNKKLLAKADYTEPPKTLSELTAMAKKLTVYNPDGSIKIVGFDPLSNFYEGPNLYVGNPWGAKWYDDNGKSAFATDPAWTEAFQWDKDLVDFYGYDKLVRFKASLGGDDSEWNSQHGFQVGRIAMIFDGEWRTIYDQAAMAKLDYGTAPFPVADDKPELYGSGLIGGTVIGIPRTSQHRAEAWLLAKTLSTDTKFLVDLGVKLGNVPTTLDSLRAFPMGDDPHFKTFLDVAENSHSSFRPLTPIGTADADLEADFLQKWESGEVPDLQAGLQQLAHQIDQQLALG